MVLTLWSPREARCIWLFAKTHNVLIHSTNVYDQCLHTLCLLHPEHWPRSGGKEIDGIPSSQHTLCWQSASLPSFFLSEGAPMFTRANQQCPTSEHWAKGTLTSPPFFEDKFAPRASHFPPCLQNACSRHGEYEYMLEIRLHFTKISATLCISIWEYRFPNNMISSKFTFYGHASSWIFTCWSVSLSNILSSS